MSSHRVEHQRYCAGVCGRWAQIYSKANSGVPFGNLSYCGLQGIFENINRASQSVSVCQVQDFVGSSKDASACGAVLPGNVIQKVVGVHEGEWPKSRGDGFGT